MKTKTATKPTTTWTEDTIMVLPIDIDKVMAHVNKERPLEPKEGGKRHYIYIGKAGIILRPKCAIMDAECCGKDIDGNEVALRYYEQEDFDNGSWNFSMCPTLEERFTLKEIEPFLCEPISLKVFMGERYNYNSRIEGNLYRWLKHFNS